MPLSASRPTFPWWIVLCLVGLDYFSSLAYLPSVAMHYTKQLAPLAGVAVVLVTLLAALPVYLYVIGRSPNGKGGVGLLEERYHGWTGKLVLLAMLGFVATDFILTRTLSVSDAATHLRENPYYLHYSGWDKPLQERVIAVLPDFFGTAVAGFLSEQLIVTLVLSISAFALYFYLVRSLSKGFVSLAVLVVVIYLALNTIVIGACLQFIWEHPSILEQWEQALRPELGDYREEGKSFIGLILLLGLYGFPPLAIGLSGFELTMATAPAVDGGPADTPAKPNGRIFRTRLLMVVAAMIMSVYVLGACFVVPLLVPERALHGDPAGAVAGSDHQVKHRALAYLAHGGPMANRKMEERASPLFGDAFGTLYDASTILILILAGASATISMREIVPEFLSRFGMQLEWAKRLGVITHLFNSIMIVVTIAFKANVSDQIFAYAASVIALLIGASLAATLDIRYRWRESALRWILATPFILTTTLFVCMGLLIMVWSPSGVLIAFLFVFVVLVTAIVSRYFRSTEMRFEGFQFADEASRGRWEEINKMEFQVLVPHDPTAGSLPDKEHEIRAWHRLATEVPIIFIEVHLGDTSDFAQKPVMSIVQEDGREVIRVSQCTSVAHVIASIGLAFREVGFPPELHFAWSNKTPVAANLDFLLSGQGNVPWMVHSLIHHAEPVKSRRPRVIVG